MAGDSGAYLNPAITFTNCLLRKLPWRRFPVYFLAQFLGGLVAAGIIYGNYVNDINAFEGHGIRTVPPSPTATAGIFCTYPKAYMTKASMFFSEFIASAILMFVIFALKDDTNNGVSRGGGNWFPLGLFFLIFGIGACFGVETGYASKFFLSWLQRLSDADMLQSTLPGTSDLVSCHISSDTATKSGLLEDTTFGKMCPRRLNEQVC